MPDERKRLRYFTGQFLQEKDFQDEQAYHLDRQRRHNKYLHTSGIADGFDVKGNPGASQVTVSPGTAVDSEGRQILLTQERSVPLGPGLGRRAFIVVSFTEGPSPLPDDQATVGGKGATRILEEALVEAIAINASNQPTPREGNNFPDGLYIRLALVTLDEAGNLSAAPDTRTFFKRAGVNLGDPVVRQITLSRDGVPPAQFPVLSCGGPAQINLQGSLAFARDGVAPAQIPTLSCTAASQLTLQGNLTVSGTLDGRDVSTDGQNLDAHIANRNNPHNVTAAQVRALSIEQGGIVSAPVSVRNTSLAGLLPFPPLTTPRLDVQTNVPGLTGNAGSLFAWNAAGAGSCAVMARVTGSPTSLPGFQPQPAAVVAIADIAGVHGVYASSRAGTHALNVDGTARITGPISTTHVVDTFINASGQRLRTGDVVKLKGTPVTRFRGLQNKAPVAEVTLADRDDDTMVIGIVDCEAIPEGNAPDTRVEADDPTFVEVGGEFYLVTLGVFAHCKVDATAAPIAVGDLLTSSQNPGHAKKATEPKLGSIIGKALEPLETGTGYISVFVNIQ